MNTKHYMNDHHDREYIIRNVIGQGNPIFAFEVNRHHKNGEEFHYITDTGIIIILNKYTLKVCSKLIARPAQLMRYVSNDKWNGQIVRSCRFISRNSIVEDNNIVIPHNLLTLAKIHMNLGYNV